MTARMTAPERAGELQYQKHRQIHLSMPCACAACHLPSYRPDACPDPRRNCASVRVFAGRSGPSIRLPCRGLRILTAAATLVSRLACLRGFMLHVLHAAMHGSRAVRAARWAVGGVPRDGPGDPGPGWRWLEVALGCARGFLDVVAVTDKGTRLRALLSIYFKYCECVLSV